MKTIHMVIGDPIAHSLSPLIHNAGYDALSIASQFEYTRRCVLPDDIDSFIDSLRATQNVRGVSVTMPHKERTMAYLDVIDPIAAEIGAVNTIINESGTLTGYNTDWIGTIAPLKALTTIKSKEVAVLGAGGAAKAMVYGLKREGARVTIYNRTLKKAEILAEQYSCQAASLSDIAAIKNADIICNAAAMNDYSLIDTTAISASQIVFDAAYSPLLTPLLAAAQQNDARVIYGTEMLLHQAFAQFQLYTGHAAPEAAMREALLHHLKGE